MIVFREFSKRFGRVGAVKALTFDVQAGEVVRCSARTDRENHDHQSGGGLIRPTVASCTPRQPASGWRRCRQGICSFLRRGHLPRHAERPGGRRVLLFASWRDVGAGTGRHEVHRPQWRQPACRRDLLGRDDSAAGTGRRHGFGSPVLLLDEPTAALDPDGLCAFYAPIDARRTRSTLLFSSHLMETSSGWRIDSPSFRRSSGRLVHRTGLTARLADRGVMKIAVDHQPDGLLENVRQLAEAPFGPPINSSCRRRQPLACRAHAVRASGVGIRGLSAEKAAWTLSIASWSEPRRGAPVLCPDLCLVGMACQSGTPRRQISTRLTGVRLLPDDRLRPALRPQILAPGEDARFDDLGCLGNYLKTAQLRQAIVYVADHRTTTWVQERTALFTRADPDGRDGIALRLSRVSPVARSGSRREERRRSIAEFSPRSCLRFEMKSIRRSSSGSRDRSSCSPAFAMDADLCRRLCRSCAGRGASGYVLSGGSGLQDFARTAASLVRPCCSWSR
jgi:hypothetical protein